MSQQDTKRGLEEVHVAKARLQISRLVLQIHDASLPATPEEDVGRGSPYSHGADQFFSFVAEVGFDTVQFGPQGMTSRGNASPYDGTIFSRNPLNLPLARLVDDGRLPQRSFQAFLEMLPPDGTPAPYSTLYDAFQFAQGEIAAAASAGDRAAAAAFLAANVDWLVPDALYAVLCRIHGDLSWRHWDRSTQGTLDQQLYAPSPDAASTARRRLDFLRTEYRQEIEDYALIQWVLHTLHQELRERLRRLQLESFADLQVGLSQQDEWAYRHLLLPRYRLGAPPSRTNPQGQPWGYPVFHPAKYGTIEAPGPVLMFVRARVRKALVEADGVRLDHPHGWVDPWVYRDEASDSFLAVQQGARLFSTPDDPRHPLLAQFAIARPEQLDRTEPEYADNRVGRLDEDQVARYAVMINEIVAALPASCRARDGMACEVLSTLPGQVAAALQHFELGRFRVVQKIDLTNPSDPYRIEHARPEDWMMLGTHDSPPIWSLAETWCACDAGTEWCAYLEQILGDDRFRTWFGADPARAAGPLVNTLFAAMLASEARHAVVFFADLFGLTGRYNEPGVINDVNWKLRAPANYVADYSQRLADGAGLNVERALALAVLNRFRQ